MEMTVKDLIEELRKLPEDTQVCIDSEDRLLPIREIYVHEDAVLGTNVVLSNEGL